MRLRGAAVEDGTSASRRTRERGTARAAMTGGALGGTRKMVFVRHVLNVASLARSGLGANPETDMEECRGETDGENASCEGCVNPEQIWRGS